MPPAQERVKMHVSENIMVSRNLFTRVSTVLHPVQHATHEQQINQAHHIQ